MLMFIAVWTSNVPFLVYGVFFIHFISIVVFFWPRKSNKNLRVSKKKIWNLKGVSNYSGVVFAVWYLMILDVAAEAKFFLSQMNFQLPEFFFCYCCGYIPGGGGGGG